MNPNYMNFFDPASGMSMGGNAYNHQSGFQNMPPTGSFMDMINGPPMGMSMFPPSQSPMTRFNHYQGMYSPYPMENSAARLQQFARQLTPRPSYLPGQSMQDQMAMYNMQQQMDRMRMKQLPNYALQRYNQPNLSPWSSRMPGSMPHLQQTPPRNPIDTMQNNTLTTEAIRLHNMQHMSSAEQPPFRKMPVLDEAPPVRAQAPLMPQRPQQPHTNSQQYINRIFSNNTDTPTYNSGTQQLPINLNSPAGGLNLPGMSFPSPQQQRQTTSFHGSEFFNFNELNNISPSPKLNTIPVPQSPKLTHFGPSTPSSVSSFDQQSCTSSQTSVTTTTTTTFATSTSNVVSTDFALKQAPTLSTSSMELNKQNDNTNRVNKFQPYFSQMEQIQQQLGRLKQSTHPQKNNELQLLTQQYHNTFQQYELAKQNQESLPPVVSQTLSQQPQQHQQQVLHQSLPASMNQQQSLRLGMGQTLAQPTTESSNAGSNLHSNNQSLPQDLLSSSSLIDGGLNIPELDAFDSKGNFLADDTKADSLFPAVFLGGTTDLFPSSSMFSGDTLSDIKNEGDTKQSQTMNQTMSTVNTLKLEEEKNPLLTNLDCSTKENIEHKNIQLQNPHIQNMNQQHFQNFFSPASMGQYFQQLPVRPMKQPDNFLPFPFHHPRFAPQTNVMMPQHMLSVSDFMSNTSTPTTSVSVNSTNANTFSTYGNMAPGPFSDARKGKGKGKTEKGGKGSGKGKVGRPLGSLNKKKKREKESKKAHELDPDDFDLLAPGELLPGDNDDNFIDPAMRRSLRERTKKKNYKDDFDYNLSDEDENKNKGSDAETAVKTVEPVITGGANALVAYRPNLEAEGEIAIIEKILAMRTTQQENVEESKMVEEFFVKYKGYSYLHCEWGTIEQLAKKDKRVHAKVKRYQQKRDTGYAFLNELDDEPFNPDYLEIDRVLDMQTTVDPVTNEKFNHYLVKWRALPYEESTWELQMNIDESIIQQFHELKKPPPEELRRFIPRPHETEWRKFLQTSVYKNSNKLHEYQLEGLNWLSFCWFKRINCILADEMGLGKTIQSISLLCAMKQYGIRGPFLVIAPLSTIANWQREFESWTDINAIVYHGSALSRNNIQQYEMYYKDEQGEFITSIYKFEAIITTYEMVLSANSFLCTIPFRCLIIDEAHRLKNQKCKLMEALNNLRMEHKVLLTGTPLQNNVEELFSLLNFLEPTRFPSQTAFSYEFGNLKSESQVEKLQQILKPMMLRRLKEDVDQNIPNKEETIVEVELTTIQKKFYRAIIEKNFSFLVKGGGYSNLPNLMNTMMELRKCCNHPFLIKGAEDKIVMDYLTSPDDPDKIQKQLKAMIESSGKMVLIDKLLPKLKLGGHKVLIFSQMIKVLNLIEDYLVAKRYTFERIDGGVQGSVRQAAIDRFCRPDSDRFVFLLCTRAGGLGINLTAADTVIIFDSDWNPQNDLQAQARCHRIGQHKPVKVYRLICRNTYEREMFDRASLKLGLDKAVLQNMNSKDSSGTQTMTKKEVEDLLKKGAYGAVMETDEDANKFCEEDIDQILMRRTQIIQIKGEGKGSTFAKASFVSDKARQDINLDDPDFWKKWARKASVDLEDLEKEHDLIVDEPRKRKQTKRFGNDGDATVEMSDLESDDETYEPHKQSRGGKGQTQFGPIERAAWTRVECFKVEKMLLIYGWSRWQQIISHAHFRQEVRHSDIEAISRTILAYCYRYYKADERSKQFFEDLINKSISKAPPKNDKHDITNQILGSAPAKTNRGRKGKGNSGRNALRRLTHQYSKPALIECNADWLTVDPETMIIDVGYRKHLQHHCSKIMGRVRLLHCLQNEIIKDAHQPISEGKHFNEINMDISVVDGDLPCSWWDATADKCLLIGTFKHGYEKYRLIRNDPALSFYHKLGPVQFNDKAPGSPDSINNPGSVERSEDPSDPEFSVTGKKKLKSKKDIYDDDSFMESDEEKDSYSLNASPISTASGKENPSDAKTNSTNPDLRWPLPTDMNTRLRRLVTAYLKLAEKEYLDIMKAEKDKQKQERLAIIALERQKKKAELQQKWTRREESDFYRVISNYGICYNRTTKIYNWERFKQLAKLEKKQDSTLLAYYEEFMAMCRKVCGKSTEEDLRKYKGSQLEEISEERASRCIQRIRLLSKIREQVLVHEKLGERLKLCQLSPDYPTWWEIGKHDKALLDGVAKHGLWRTEYHVLLDPDSLFKEIVTKSSQNKNNQSAQKSGPKAEMQSGVNGEHSEDSLTKLDPLNFTRKLTAYIEDSDSRQSMDSRIALPILTDEYAHVLSSWPKDKAIVSHLEKVCHCVIKGEWPKPTRFDITPIVSKLPAVSRTVISTVAQLTRAEPTSDKYPGVRGEEAASRDFKIKSIDGLKLTVKTETKKRKRKVDGEPDISTSEFVDDSKLKKKKIIDGVPIVEGSLRHQSSGVKYHIPKSSHQVISNTPIIHFPAGVRVPKVSPPSKVAVASITSPSAMKDNVSISRNTGDKKETVYKVLKSDKTAAESTKVARSSEQPVGIHIDSPNANVRIVGSKIEVKEKPSIKREIDMKSEVILKVPDPSKFLPSQEKMPVNKEKVHLVKDSKKRAKQNMKSRDVFPPDQDKLLKVTNVSVKCEHRKEQLAGSQGPPDSPRTRPERSAKKKAKDSISEITEAEHMSLSKELLPTAHGERTARSPRWSSEVRSPTHVQGTHEYFRYDYYSERAVRSPGIVHRHPSRSSPPIRHLSPDRRVHSPPLHSIHGRPLSPLLHRHSPPPRHVDHSPRLRDVDIDHMKHLYTEPLSPRHRSRDYYYSERSRSPIYYEYRLDKEVPYTEHDRHSPQSIKLDRKSPSKGHRSPVHKHESFPFVHLTEPRSPVGHRSRRHERHSPAQEGRFPYGHIVDWDGPRYKRTEMRSPSLSSLDSYQYQPLSRLTPENKVSNVNSPGSIRNRSISPDNHRKWNKTPREDASHCHGERSPTHNHEMMSVRRSTDSDFKMNTGISAKNPPLAFYPIDCPKTSTGKDMMKSKQPKTSPIERSVIEIPEETVRTQSERKTAIVKRKSIGLLEMKIQGLKKQKLNENNEPGSAKKQSDDSEIATIPSATNVSATSVTVKSPKGSKSISAVIDSLSNAAVRTSVISPPAGQVTAGSSLKKPTRKSLSLDTIAKNLSRSLEQSESSSLTSLTPTRVSPLSPTFDKSPTPRLSLSATSVKSPPDSPVLRTFQRTVDPVNKTPPCTSPTVELNSPLQRVAYVTVATSKSPEFSVTSNSKKSLLELVTEENTSISAAPSLEMTLSPTDCYKCTSPKEKKSPVGSLDRKIEELRGKVLPTSITTIGANSKGISESNALVSISHYSSPDNSTCVNEQYDRKVSRKTSVISPVPTDDLSESISEQLLEETATNIVKAALNNVGKNEVFSKTPSTEAPILTHADVTDSKLLVTNSRTES